VPGFAPVAEADVILAGARALDPAESDLLASSGGAITACDPGYDPDGRIARAAIDVALALAGRSAATEPA